MGKKFLLEMLLLDFQRKLPKPKISPEDLPRVAELFEARKPKDSAIIAENDGVKLNLAKK
jgi:hypothetical protein